MKSESPDCAGTHTALPLRSLREDSCRQTRKNRSPKILDFPHLSGRKSLELRKVGIQRAPRMPDARSCSFLKDKITEKHLLAVLDNTRSTNQTAVGIDLRQLCNTDNCAREAPNDDRTYGNGRMVSFPARPLHQVGRCLTAR